MRVDSTRGRLDEDLQKLYLLGTRNGANEVSSYNGRNAKAGTAAEDETCRDRASFNTYGNLLSAEEGQPYSSGHRRPNIGESNIWGQVQAPRRHSNRQSMDVPPVSFNANSDAPYNQPSRRYSLDSLGSLKAIWGDKQSNGQYGQMSSHSQPAIFHGMPPAASQPQLDSSFSGLNLQGQALQGPSFSLPHGQQNSEIQLEGTQIPHVNGGWDNTLDSRQALMSDFYGTNGFGQQPLADSLAGSLQPAFVSEPQSHYSEPPYRPSSYQMSQYSLAGIGNSPVVRERASLLDGIGPEELRLALQHPRTSQYLRQHLELEAALAAKSHPHSLEERLTTARQLAQGMQQLHRYPPPPPPRMTRPNPPPPLDTAAVQRYLAQSGLGTSSRSSSLNPRNGKERGHLMGSRPKCCMDALDAKLEALVESLKPSLEELERQEAAFTKVSKILMEEFPHAKVHQFGSTANSLSICGNNDIDVCLEIFEPEGESVLKPPLVEKIGVMMSEARMTSILSLPNARVPVVKFAVPESATKVDVTVNNILAISNTKLLRDYAAIDSRLLKLAFIVKHWAKRRQVNDSYRGTLSSYCYVLMCIHFLQNRQPPILPCLQSIQPPTYIRTVGHWKCDYYDKAMPDFGRENKETLAELVWKFFEFWAWAHDFNNSVVSVRTGKFLTKAQKDWTRRIGNERHLVCIEDPFETSHDLGRTVDRQTSGILHKEFDRAACIIRDQADPLAQLFDPYRAGTTD